MKKISITKPVRFIAIVSIVALATTSLSNLIIHGLPFQTDKAFYEINLPGLTSFNFFIDSGAWTLLIPLGIFLTGIIILYLFRIGEKFITDEESDYDNIKLFKGQEDDLGDAPIFFTICLLIVAQAFFLPKLFWLIPFIIALIGFMNKLINQINLSKKTLFFLLSPIIISATSYAFIYSSVEFAFLITGVLIVLYAISALITFIAFMIIMIIVAIYIVIIEMLWFYTKKNTKSLLKLLKDIPDKLGISIQ